jgi:hypothetical protein
MHPFCAAAAQIREYDEDLGPIQIKSSALDSIGAGGPTVLPPSGLLDLTEVVLQVTSGHYRRGFSHQEFWGVRFAPAL